MRVLFLAAEAAPLVKVGGLGDVAGSLPRALRSLGHDVRVAIPGYGAIDWMRWKPALRARFPVPHAWGDQNAEIYETESDGVPVLLVTGPPILHGGPVYGSHIGEDAPKFIFFSLAALWSCEAIGWKPDLLHAHDSHTGPAVYWLATEGRRNAFFRSVASLLTIHNLPYTGEGAGRYLGDYGIETSPALEALPGWARDSMLGVGLVAADWLSTVSPTYAREILTPQGGRGLDGLLRTRQERLTGILNGIDENSWNPATDAALPERFGADSLDRRAVNKRALREEAHLEPDPRAPLLGAVSRLDDQKGLDVAVPAVRRWLELGGAFILLGSGDSGLKGAYAAIARDFPHRAGVRLGFDGNLARRIYGGADLILIPSRYEPCGLTQMIAMRYGAPPVARRTGGLADTVVDAGEAGGGTGWMFDELSPGSLLDALERAARVYRDPERFREVQRRGMSQDFSWRNPARRYSELYERIRQWRDAAG
jgi:starch synthase